jgi:hypothetical protein
METLLCGSGATRLATTLAGSTPAHIPHYRLGINNRPNRHKRRMNISPRDRDRRAPQGRTRVMPMQEAFRLEPVEQEPPQ